MMDPTILDHRIGRTEQEIIFTKVLLEFILELNLVYMTKTYSSNYKFESNFS